MGNFEETLYKCNTGQTTWTVIRYTHPDDDFIEIAASQTNVEQNDFEAIATGIKESGCQRILFNGRYLNSNQMIDLAAALAETTAIACFILTGEIYKAFRSVGIPVEVTFDNYEHGYPTSISFLTSRPAEVQTEHGLLQDDVKIKIPKKNFESELLEAETQGENVLSDEFDY